ncbi:hypothetical protein HMPREF1869_00495 [Bacteroidales bacterium KA00251]|nr:hypothetical protein HMPREF1869_00495 [Bacteroidales bacterium KA00251]
MGFPIVIILGAQGRENELSYGRVDYSSISQKFLSMQEPRKNRYLFLNYQKKT